MGNIIEDSTAGREHFSQTIPGHQIAWDSTSLGEFKACPRSYFYSHIIGLRGRREAIPLTFGIHYHAALELYDRVRFKGADHEEAVRLVVRYCGSVCRTTDEAGNFTGLWDSQDTTRNPYTLIRSVVWYMDHFEHDPLETLAKANGDPMVELSFRMELDSLRTPDGRPYLLCGHMDRVARFGEAGIFIGDRKTTKNQLNGHYFDGYSPDNQMSLYTLAAKVVFKVPALGAIIDGAQITPNFTRFQRGFVHRSQAQTNEWVEDLQYWLGQNLAYAEAQYWPMNDKSCSMYGGCKYRGICSKDPAVRHHLISQGFEVRPWNPLVPR